MTPSNLHWSLFFCTYCKHLEQFT